MADNLFSGSEEREFFVWVNPRDPLVKYHIRTVGSFTSSDIFPSKSNLMFIPNEEFTGAISPFQLNQVQGYCVEYNLEIQREHSFGKYPSRLNSVFLFSTKEEAEKYKSLHESHVKDRILKRALSNGKFLFSEHDAGWIDFLKLRHGMEDQTITDCVHAYWQGVNVEDCQLSSGAKTGNQEAWTQAPVREILFLGRIDFPDKRLDYCESQGNMV